MPTIVYFVHGMGCGTATGNPPAAGTAWTDSLGGAMQWITSTFKLGKLTTLDPIPAKPPAGSDAADAVWLVPVSYHSAFDEFRRGAADRKVALRGLALGLTDAYIAKLSDTEFAWASCLDVLLWWADVAQARTLATTRILSTITKADQLARSIPGATVRSVLVSHSLGTAAATYALRHLGSNAAWPAVGGFDRWFTLANVAPFLIQTEDVYGPPLLPGQQGTMVRSMVVAGNEADPIPWLLPWRHWNPTHAGTLADAWARQVDRGTVSVVQTLGVATPPGGTPEITGVHGFTNYLMSPVVAPLVAGAIRGAAFDDGELRTIDVASQWKQLPQLSCLRTPSALEDLRKATAAYIDEIPMPDDVLQRTAGWLGRLLRAADLLLAARSAC